MQWVKHIHHVFKNMILNQGCSQKYNNNENIHVDNNECPSQGFFSIPSVIFKYFVYVLHRLDY